jgi:uncharacterized protein (DUF3084 family)
VKFSRESFNGFIFLKNIEGGVEPAPSLFSFNQNEINQLRSENDTLKLRLENVSAREQQLTQAYDDLKMENVNLKEEVRQLKVTVQMLLLRVKVSGSLSQDHRGKSMR